MRYAILAALLMIGMFGMSAPVVGAVQVESPCITVIDVTGPTTLSNGQTSMNVVGTHDHGGNILVNLKINVNGVQKYNKNFVKSSPWTIVVAPAGSWLPVTGQSWDFIATATGGVTDTLTTVVGP